MITTIPALSSICNEQSINVKRPVIRRGAGFVVEEPALPYPPIN